MPLWVELVGRWRGSRVVARPGADGAAHLYFAANRLPRTRPGYISIPNMLT